MSKRKDIRQAKTKDWQNSKEKTLDKQKFNKNKRQVNAEDIR